MKFILMFKCLVLGRAEASAYLSVQSSSSVKISSQGKFPEIARVYNKDNCIFHRLCVQLIIITAILVKPSLTEVKPILLIFLPEGPGLLKLFQGFEINFAKAKS